MPRRKTSADPFSKTAPRFAFGCSPLRRDKLDGYDHDQPHDYHISTHDLHHVVTFPEITVTVTTTITATSTVTETKEAKPMLTWTGKSPSPKAAAVSP